MDSSIGTKHDASDPELMHPTEESNAIIIPSLIQHGTTD